MSLPKRGQVYLTGKTVLQNGHQHLDDTDGFFYDGLVDCKPIGDETPTIQTLFRYQLRPAQDPPSNGIYNVNAKIVTFRKTMVPPTTSSPTENCLLYGDIVDMSEWDDDMIPDEHSTQISGSGWIKSTHPLTLSFVLHICQHVRGALPTDDIAIACYINSIHRFLILENLPSPSNFLRFSGELGKCEQKMITDMSLTSSLSIYME
ncbi:hypothetical protein V8E53_013159 [Lactarius tabidus]